VGRNMACANAVFDRPFEIRTEIRMGNGMTPLFAQLFHVNTTRRKTQYLYAYFSMFFIGKN
jgi:hypothetical protein